jgi:hypothetical protein
LILYLQLAIWIEQDFGLSNYTSDRLSEAVGFRIVALAFAGLLAPKYTDLELLCFWHAD